MTYESSVTHDAGQDCIRVVSNGDKDISTARQLWEQIASLSEEVKLEVRDLILLQYQTPSEERPRQA